MWNIHILKMFQSSWVIRKHVWKKIALIWLYEKRYKFERKYNFWIKFWYDNFKNCNQIVLEFQICFFRTDVEITRQKASRSSRVERAGSSRISVLNLKRIFFLILWTMCLESIRSEICVVAGYICDRKKRLSTARDASLPSASLAKIEKPM